MAENEKIQVELTVLDNMSNEIKAISANMQQQFRRQNEKLKETKGAFASLGDEIKGSFVGAIRSGIIAYAGFEVVGKITGFLKDARLEYKESVQTQLQLRQALGFTSQALNEQAAALGRKLVVDNEEITAVQIKLANYVKSEEQIKKLTPAVLDLAAATGMDMASAANMVARAISDDSGELGRFKIAIEGAKGSGERIQSVIDGITKGMGGQAEAAAQAKDAIDSYGVALGNIKEKTGEFITTSATKFFNAYRDMGRMLAGTSIEQIRKEYADAARAKIEADKNATKLIADQAESDRKKIANDNLNKKTEEARQVAEKKATIERQNLENSLAIYSMVRESEISIMANGINKEFALLDMKYEIETIKYAGNKEMLAAIDQQYANNAIAITTRYNQVQKELQDELDERKIQSDADEVERKKKLAEAEADRIEREAKHKKETNQQYISNSINTFAALFQGQKQYIAMYKTLAIAAATFDAYRAANVALADPLLLGPTRYIAASAAIAAGLANVVKISTAKYATGTAYASGGMSLVGENGPEYVNLPRGARVYNNTQSRTINNTTGLTVNIMDTSGNVIETVRAQLRSGAGDALVRDLVDKMARSM